MHIIFFIAIHYNTIKISNISCGFEVLITTSALRLLALRGRWTLYVRRRSPSAPGIRLINYKGDNISKYVCPSAIIDIARKMTKFEICKIFEA